ncbi:50S ribosomal protein L15 [Frigoriglobus tundricola]|uniref:Large ribosomal subunit protein uL15 n=1 Tax=Frigoriglobus tundricola TaxID=2774151 RepID=A0A6M5YVW1_9BACT|nr:50S ribosomal protein L15 [Frigoriglobus tundricola]QJW97536.1 LSU ribosomal protein L15p (L27Ae) [Frigoriglobus tundricola]
MDLTTVSTGVAKRKLKRRVGRGIGSGQGKTSGLGMKGQYASAGARLPSGLFEGGQMPLYRRWPKRGFSHATWDKHYAIVNVGDLDAFDANSTVDMAALKARRLVVGTFDGVRILGEGELTKPLTVKADHFSKSALEKVKKAGGTADVLPKPKKPVRNKMGSKKKALDAAKAAKAPKTS